MSKLDATVKRETLYVAFMTLILSALMQAIFLIVGEWDYTVLLGNLFGGGVAVLNFLLMGLTVQTSLELEEKEARGHVKLSMTLRMLMLVLCAALGVLLPCFSVLATLIPLFFVRIAVALRPLADRFMKNDD